MNQSFAKCYKQQCNYNYYLGEINDIIYATLQFPYYMTNISDTGPNTASSYASNISFCNYSIQLKSVFHSNLSLCSNEE